MQYDNLLSYIQDLITSPKYNFKLKFFDDKGNLSITMNDIRWISLINENVMIELMHDNNKVISVWKDTTNENPYIIEIIQKIRKQAILNGVEVKVVNYNELSRGKIRNIIKQQIAASKMTKKDDNMEQVKESALTNSLWNIYTTVKSARRASDMVVTEGLRISRTIQLLNEIGEEIGSLKCFEGLDIKTFCNGLSVCKSLNEMNEYVNNYEDKALIKKLNENISKFKNVGKFIKNRYSSGIVESIVNEGALKFYPNIKLYRNIIVETDDLASAYNELKPLIKEAKCRTDIIRVLKQNPICENHNVKQRDLINYWLNQDLGAKPTAVSTTIQYVSENTDGRLTTIPCSNVLGVRLIAEHLNNGGSINDKVVSQIIDECKVNDELVSFCDSYKNRDLYKKIANKMCLESSYLLHNTLNYFKNNYRKRNYSEKYVKIMEAKLRTNDPALYYISEELQEYENQDVKILSEGLKMFAKSSALNNIVMDIIDNGLKIGRQVNESKGARSKLEKIYIKLNENLKNPTNLAVSSSIFYLINKPIALDENNKEYIKCLLRHTN